MSKTLFLVKTHVDAYVREGRIVAAHDRRPMYASRKVLNGDELHAWAVRQGFSNVTPPEKMHVTVAYSRAPVHHESVETDKGTLMAHGSHVAHLGDDDAVVMHLEHPALHARHHYMRSMGASWDYDTEGYNPHVSISYKGQPIPEGLQPFDGVLHLGPERVEDLKSGWGAGVAKEAEKPMAKGGDFGTLTLFTKARVGSYLRNGKLVNIAGYDGRQAHAKPAHDGQMALFTHDEAPPPAPRPNPYKGKDPVKDTPDLFDGLTARERGDAHERPESEKLAQEPVGNGAEFGDLYHGAPVPFDKFDPGKRNSSGAGYDHQGKGFYLTDDPHGYARFFAREGGHKLALNLMMQGKKEESDKISDGKGHVMSVKLKPSAKVLRMEDAPAYVKQLFDNSVGNKEVAEELRQTVRKLGYHGLNFEEPNFPEGWRTKHKARTTVIYDTDKAEITGNHDAGGLDLPDEHPYWDGKSGPDLDAKHPLARAQKRYNEALDRYSAARRKGGGDGFEKHILEGARATRDKLQQAFRAFHATGDGTELSDKEGKRHAILLPDASNPGKYRYQMFDHRGFYSHSTHDTPEEAVADAASNGYLVHNPGILDKLAGDEEWAHGMAINAIMQAHNSGQMDWKTAMDKMAALHNEREAKRPIESGEAGEPRTGVAGGADDGAALAGSSPAPAAATSPADNHPSKPTRSLLNLVPEDRRAEWLDLHRRQHEMHHYDLGQIKEELEKKRAPMNRALSALRESEAAATQARKGGDLPGTDERIRAADNAVARHSIEFQRHSKEVERLKGMHQTVYERVAKLGREKHAIASETGDMDIDWASMKQRAPEDQRKHEKTMLAAYRAHYKAKDKAAREAKRAAKAATMAKAWDWLGTQPMRGQMTVFLSARQA